MGSQISAAESQQRDFKSRPGWAINIRTAILKEAGILRLLGLGAQLLTGNRFAALSRKTCTSRLETAIFALTCPWPPTPSFCIRLCSPGRDQSLAAPHSSGARVAISAMDSFLLRLRESWVKSLSIRMCFQSLFLYTRVLLKNTSFPADRAADSTAGWVQLISFLEVSFPPNFLFLTLALFFLLSVYGMKAE